MKRKPKTLFFKKTFLYKNGWILSSSNCHYRYSSFFLVIMDEKILQQKLESVPRLATLDANTQTRERVEVYETIRGVMENPQTPSAAFDDKIAFLIRHSLTDSENKDDMLAQAALKTLGRLFSRKACSKHWSPAVVTELCDLLRRILLSSTKKANITIAAWIVSQQAIWHPEVTPQRPLPEV